MNLLDYMLDYSQQFFDGIPSPKQNCLLASLRMLQLSVVWVTHPLPPPIDTRLSSHSLSQPDWFISNPGHKVDVKFSVAPPEDNGQSWFRD